MAEVIKVGAFGIVGVMLALQFKGQKPEYSMYIGFALSILIFCYVLKRAEVIMLQLDIIRKFLGNAEGYLSILLKVIGITYICEFSASICKDAGYGAVADQIEILGKLSVMLAGLPILFSMIEQIQSFV
ncbi:MAG: stage III sporulation protein AD [Lachnospiraceae bacterium]|nr:stage III sporulation protein AD [Lachnospiraceae bacterium]